MATPEQTPLQQVANTVADTAPKLAIAAKAIALEDHRRMLRDYAARVADGHRAMAKAIGMEDSVVLAASEENDMGHLIVTGDINVGDPSALQAAVNALSGKVAAQPTAAETAVSQIVTAPSAAPWWQKAALVAAMAAGSAGTGLFIPWALGAFQKASTPAATSSADQTLYELSISPLESNP